MFDLWGVQAEEKPRGGEGRGGGGTEVAKEQAGAAVTTEVACTALQWNRRPCSQLRGAAVTVP